MSSGLTSNPNNINDENAISQQESSSDNHLDFEKDLTHKIAGTTLYSRVKLELTYTDFLRFVKLIEKDEALRQRSRDKAKQGSAKPTRSRKKYMEPIRYKVLDSEISAHD